MDSNRSTLHDDSDPSHQLTSAAATMYASSISDQDYHGHNAKELSAITDAHSQASLDRYTLVAQTPVGPNAPLTTKSGAAEPVIYTVFAPRQKAFIVVTVAVAGLLRH
ncbi:hypothetical protein H4R35_002517 [Dimargaris xerosporica]|nr:hypothetical protein H4R35_002517 [Dimargaris xerosporica]